MEETRKNNKIVGIGLLILILYLLFRQKGFVGLTTQQEEIEKIIILEKDQSISDKISDLGIKIVSQKTLPDGRIEYILRGRRDILDNFKKYIITKPEKRKVFKKSGVVCPDEIVCPNGHRLKVKYQSKKSGVIVDLFPPGVSPIKPTFKTYSCPVCGAPVKILVIFRDTEVKLIPISEKPSERQSEVVCPNGHRLKVEYWLKYSGPVVQVITSKTYKCPVCGAPVEVSLPNPGYEAKLTSIT